VSRPKSAHPLVGVVVLLVERGLDFAGWTSLPTAIALWAIAAAVVWLAILSWDPIASRIRDEDFWPAFLAGVLVLGCAIGVGAVRITDSPTYRFHYARDSIRKLEFDLKRSPGETFVSGEWTFIFEEAGRGIEPMAPYRIVYRGAPVMRSLATLRAGCYSEFEVAGFRILLVVLDDRIQSTRLGVLIDAATHVSEKGSMKSRINYCP
jgi:hypothetical protein